MSQTISAPTAADPAIGLFTRSMAISAVRCLLTYIVFPWVLPLAGVATGVPPVIGLPIGVVAIAANIASIRRFWRADHRWKWPVAVVCLGVIGLLSVLVAEDVTQLS